MTYKHHLLLFLCCLALLLTGCAESGTVAQSAVPPRAPQATAPAITPPSIPTVAPSATPLPSPMPTSSATPAPTAVPAPRVGLQVGHWQLENLPDEMTQFRTWSGSYYRGYDEWEINIEIARRVQAQLEDAGVTVDLLPTVIPIGYSADAFVSIHADGASGDKAQVRHGWKLATPYRASPASEALAAAVSESYGRVTGLPQDTRGQSVDMRAYYAFASYRYWHSIAPTTPAILIETGFMTYPQDWALLYKQPDVVARGIAEGLLRYLAAHDPSAAAARAPVAMPMLKPGAADLALRRNPNADSTIVQRLPATQRLVPLAERDGWYLVLTRGVWDIGWVRAADVVATDEPLVPPQLRPAE